MGKPTTFLWSKRGGRALLHKPGRQSNPSSRSKTQKRIRTEQKMCVRESAVSNTKSTTRNREHPMVVSCCGQCPCLRTAPCSRRLVDRILSGLELETFNNLVVVLEPLDMRDIYDSFQPQRFPPVCLEIQSEMGFDSAWGRTKKLQGAEYVALCEVGCDAQ